jgi:hypothetical protein
MRKLILATALTALVPASAARAARYLEARCVIEPLEYVLSIDTETHGAAGWTTINTELVVGGSFQYQAGHGTWLIFPNKVMWLVADPESGWTSGVGFLDGSNRASPARCEPFRAVHYNFQPEW